MRAIVVGAGIGGLTTALSLHAAGIHAEVYESVREIRPLGVGINLQPNAVRELIELGLGDELARVAIETSTLAYYNRHGQLIWSEPRGLAGGWNWPQYSVHRGELQATLLKAVSDRLGTDAVRTGHRLLSVDQDESAVSAVFEDRGTGKTLPPVRGDILIGADGIHSTVRRQFILGEGTPVFSGGVMWRGTTVTDPYLDGRTQVVIGHRYRRIVIYPMSRQVAETGRSQVNWLTYLANPGVDRHSEDWNLRVQKDRFFYGFEDWKFDWLDVAGLIRSTEEVFEYPETDRDPLPQWSFGRVTLLGDAAHAMRPIGSQAGSQAIVDARVIAKAVAEASSPEAGLQKYEEIRRPQTNDVILRNREYGPEIVMQMAEERAPHGFDRIEDVIPPETLREVALTFKKAAGFAPDDVNNRPSLDVVPKRRHV